MQCPKCESLKIVKNGKRNRLQSFKCSVCDYQFTKDYLRADPVVIDKAIDMHKKGIPNKIIAVELNRDVRTIDNWLGKYIEFDKGCDKIISGLVDKRFNFSMDKQFVDYFDKKLHQVFLYLIDECQLNCKQCLYKLENNFYLSRKDIDPVQALWMVEDFYRLGARKLTLMGGEPTLYRKIGGRKPLFDLIDKAKNIGYKYVRIDTNGQFERELLEQPSMQKLDEITFSLDGPTADINDQIRGAGTFDKIVENIKYAVNLGYNVSVTCCIHKKLVERDENSDLYISRMVYFVDSLGVRCLNFHDLFKGGIPRDHWTGDLDISIDKWFEVWTEMQKNIEKDEYPISLRIPQSFVAQDEFDAEPNYYGYCSVKTADRVLVHPNGIIRVCSLMIGTPYGIARYKGNEIIWDDGYTNEAIAHEMNVMTPCTNQTKRDIGFMKPTCVSFKPRQNEFVWKLVLDWERKKD